MILTLRPCQSAGRQVAAATRNQEKDEGQKDRRCPGRARHPTGCRFKPAAKAGGGPAGRSGAAPHGVRVQAGGDGRGRGGVQAITRARHPTWPGFKQAATAGRGTGRSVGCGASRSEGQDGRRRRKGGPAGRSGAAHRRAKVKTGGDGSGRGGAPRSPARLGACPRRGVPLSPMPGLRRGSSGGGGGLRAARAPRLHLPASSKPRSPHHPLPDHPEWPKRALPAG